MNDLLMSVDFNPRSFMKNHREHRPFGHVQHDEGTRHHDVDLYRTMLTDSIEAKWSVCAQCNEIRKPRLIGYTKEDGYDVAYVRDLEGEQ